MHHVSCHYDYQKSDELKCHSGMHCFVYASLVTVYLFGGETSTHPGGWTRNHVPASIFVGLHQKKKQQKKGKKATPFISFPSWQQKLLLCYLFFGTQQSAQQPLYSAPSTVNNEKRCWECVCVYVLFFFCILHFCITVSETVHYFLNIFPSPLEDSVLPLGYLTSGVFWEYGVGGVDTGEWEGSGGKMGKNSTWGIVLAPHFFLFLFFENFWLY